jgi:hypothetical protein
MLACACALAQSAPTQPKPVPPIQEQTFHPERVGPDTVVVDIQGICSGVGNDATTKSPCATTISRSQFDAMFNAIGVNGPNPTAAARKSFAESYAQTLALADAAQKAGIEKDPDFTELMKVVRVRILGEVYRRSLETKYGTPSEDDIQKYFKENTAKFETVKVDRVIIPKISGRKVSGTAEDAVKFVNNLANEIRERAVKGEDMTVLQADAYKKLSLPAPPNSDMGSRRRGTLPAAVEGDIFSLKPGEVTKLEVEPSGFTIYRLRSRDIPSVDSVRGEIQKDLHMKNVETTIKAVMDSVHTNLNLDYFTPYNATKQVTQRPGMQPHPLQVYPATGASATPAAGTPASASTPKP